MKWERKIKYKIFVKAVIKSVLLANEKKEREERPPATTIQKAHWEPGTNPSTKEILKVGEWNSTIQVSLPLPLVFVCEDV